MYYVNIKINIPQNFILNAIWLVCSGHSFWIKHTCILYNGIQQLFEKSLGPIFTKHPSFASDEILRKVLESWCFQEVKTKSLWRIVNCWEQEGDFLRWWKSAQVYRERAEKQSEVFGDLSASSPVLSLWTGVSMIYTVDVLYCQFWEVGKVEWSRPKKDKEKIFFFFTLLWAEKRWHDSSQCNLGAFWLLSLQCLGTSE